MTRAETAPLDEGAPFSNTEFRLVRGGSLTLPVPVAEGFTILLAYRGYW